MKMTHSAKLITGLSLMAGLFWGCQDLLSQKDGSAKEPDALTSDASALRLSIKDDSACREQWNAILDARSAGHADSAAEKSFLADCVVEIKPGKDKLPPFIPPHLRPDSISRCRWIVAQIDGGRDEMTVSYKRYCPEDCDTLVAKDSTRHRHLCRDHHGHGVDTTKPPKPVDSCKIFRDRLANVDSTSVEAANLRQYLLTRCGKPPVPNDTLPKPVDSCKIFRDRLANVDSTSVEAANLRQYLLTRCGKPPVPNDTLPKPVDSCKIFRDRLANVDSTSVEAANLRQYLLTRCGKPPVPNDTLPKPVDSCKIYRDRLANVDSTSVEAANLRQYLLTRCGKPPVPNDTLPKPVDSCKIFRDRLANVDSTSVEAANLRQYLLTRCGKPVDTTKPPKPADSCKIFRAALAGLDSTSAQAASLRELLLARCGKPPVPNDTLPKPPLDSLPKPIPVKPAPNCDVLRAKLLTLDAASADSKRLVDAILANCTEAKP